ncbi:MAG: hypothetical protein LBU23_01250 [Planctomycetota bacterium]|jgi:hypothetical protein|nr:hypothetical protein [Planctomycetota bacterium]
MPYVYYGYILIVVLPADFIEELELVAQGQKGIAIFLPGFPRFDALAENSAALALASRTSPAFTPFQKRDNMAK